MAHNVYESSHLDVDVSCSTLKKKSRDALA